MAGNGELLVTQKQWMTDYWLDEMGVILKGQQLLLGRRKDI